jgi:hypothetical protein
MRKYTPVGKGVDVSRFSERLEMADWLVDMLCYHSCIVFDVISVSIEKRFVRMQRLLAFIWRQKIAVRQNY